MNINPKSVAFFVISFFVIGLAFILMSWFFSFNSLFYIDKIFSITNPLGMIGIILMLVIGGFYLFKIGVTVLQNSF